MCALLPHARQLTTHPSHTVVVGVDASVSLNGLEDDRFVEKATWPLTKAQTSAHTEKASALCDFLIAFHLRVENTRTHEGME